MHTSLSESLQHDPRARQAQAILGQCVHCGFCTATCPTYRLLGDELDSPRGRIYLIKQMLEGAPATRATQQHLDRCLTCRHCETTCPSGVSYGRLLDVGRQMVESQVPRPWWEATTRALLWRGITAPAFVPLMRTAAWLRPLLPSRLRRHLPLPRHGYRQSPVAHAQPTQEPQQQVAQAAAPRAVLLAPGCAQRGLAPNIDAATTRVLRCLGVLAWQDAAQAYDAASTLSGVTTRPASSAPSRCCGALPQHLGEEQAALDLVRHNVRLWAPLLESGAIEAIISNASGCGVMLKDYGHLLRFDAELAEAAARVAAAVRDIGEWLQAELQHETARQRLQANLRLPEAAPALAFHPPCTLQHGLKLADRVPTLLRALNISVQLPQESMQCCGSAGVYSVLQPTISKALRARKLSHLHALAPQRILTANIGCQHHLQAASDLPVQHWVEYLDECLVDTPDSV